MPKLVDLQQGVSVPTGGGGLSFNPLLRELVAGVDTLIAPDQVYAIPKEAAASSSSITAMGVGALVVTHNNGGAIDHDILTIRWHSVQRLLAAVFGPPIRDARRYFTILDVGPDATRGAVYEDDDDTTRRFIINVTKVSGDASLRLTTTQIAGTTVPTTGGLDNLSLVSGTGDANIAYTVVQEERYEQSLQATSIAAVGTAINPLLNFAGTAVAPHFVIPMPKVVPGNAADWTFVPTALGVGNITIDTNEVGAVDHDIVFLRFQQFQALTAALFGAGQDRRRYFTILDAAAATRGAIYEDDDDVTRQFRVDITKVALDGSLFLSTTQIAGTTPPTLAGPDILSRVSGTGDLNVPYTATFFEKLIDFQLAESVPAGAGLTFDPELVENGVRVQPHIVIAIPKAVVTAPFVPTDLTAAPGDINVRHSNVGAIDHDIMSLRIHSMFFDIG